MKFFVLLFLMSCHDYDFSASKQLEQQYDNELWSPKIFISHGSYNAVEAIADRLVKNNGKDAILTGNVQADFFNEKGEHISTLYSDTISINENNNDLAAFGKVKVVSDSGYVLETNHIIWDNQYRMIISNDSILFTTTNKDSMRGIGFESDIDLSQWKIFKPQGVARAGITSQ